MAPGIVPSPDPAALAKIRKSPAPISFRPPSGKYQPSRGKPLPPRGPFWHARCKAMGMLKVVNPVHLLGLMMMLNAIATPGMGGAALAAAPLLSWLGRLLPKK